MRACVLTQKSEEAPASSASLLATPMIYNASARTAENHHRNMRTCLSGPRSETHSTL